MAKEVAMPESLEGMPWPANGLNLATEFASQPPGTTPIGVNVRTYEALALRARGGSRSGLSQYIQEQVLDISSKIQHVGVIVDPTTEALIDDWPGIDFILDPSTNNKSIRNPAPPRHVRRGGGGGQPNRNKKKIKIPWTFVQGGGGVQNAAPGIPIVGTNSTPITQGDLLLIAVAIQPMATGNAPFPPINNDATVVVADNFGNSYTNLGYVRKDINGDPNTFRSAGICLSLWYAIANASGIWTQTITPNTTQSGQFGTIPVAIETAEFSGNALTSVLDGQSSNTAQGTSLTTGSVSCTAKDALVGCFYVFGGNVFTFSFPAAFQGTCALPKDTGSISYGSSSADNPRRWSLRYRV